MPTLASGSLTYRWSDDAAYDSDWGVVTFRDGRIQSVTFNEHKVSPSELSW